MSQSPLGTNEASQTYLDNWNALATRIRKGQSFSGRERNCCFLNTKTERFADVSAVTGFDHLDDGRGMAFCDWDGDGDVDIWTANRTGPRIRLLRNNSALRNRFLSLQLIGESCNRDAIGARVEIRLTDPNQPPILKTVRAGQGFLSQSSKRLHFGLGMESTIDQISIRWPGSNAIQVHKNIKPNHHYRIRQSSEPEIIPKRPKLPLTSQPVPIEFPTGAGRTVVTQEYKWNSFHVLGLTDDSRQSISLASSDKPILINLWASWCQPCAVEMQQLNDVMEAQPSPNVRIMALCVDRLEDSACDLKSARKMAEMFSNVNCYLATDDALRQMTELHHRIIYRNRSLPLPTSFLFTADGRLITIYKGPLEVEQLRQDLSLVDADAQKLARAANRFGGRNVLSWFSPHPISIAKSYVEAEYFEDADATLKRFLQNPDSVLTKTDKSNSVKLQIRIARATKDGKRLVHKLTELSQLHPENPEIQIELVSVLVANRQLERATLQMEQLSAKHDLSADQMVKLGGFTMTYDRQLALAFFAQATKKSPEHAAAGFSYAMALQVNGRIVEAFQVLDAFVKKYPDHLDAANNLAYILATSQNETIRDPQRSIAIASRVCDATNHQKIVYLDTLAAAFASNQQFDQAIQTIETAIELAKTQNDLKTLDKLEKRLQEYDSRTN